MQSSRTDAARKFFWLCAVTLFSLTVVPGYDVLINDSQFYLPFALNHAGFAGDFLAQSRAQFGKTIFCPLISLGLKSGINLYFLLFALSAATRFLFFSALYRLAAYFSERETLSLAFPLLMCLPQPVFGTAVHVLEFELVPRCMALAASLWALSEYYLGRKKRAGLWLILGAAFHVPTAFPFLLIAAAESFWPAVPALALAMFAYMRGNADPAWQAVLLDRLGYTFVSLWGWKAVSSLLEYAAVCAVICLKCKERRVRLALLVPAALALAGFAVQNLNLANPFLGFYWMRTLVLWKIFIPLFVFRSAFACAGLRRWAGVSLGLSMIFSSSFSPVLAAQYLVLELSAGTAFEREAAIFSWIFPAAAVAALWKTDYRVLAAAAIGAAALFGERRFAAALAALLLCFCALRGPAFRLRPAYLRDASISGLCSWASGETAPGSVFAAEPFSKALLPIREEAGRGVFVRWKDGGPGLFLRDYALEWSKRMRLCGYKNPSGPDFARLASEYRVSYFVSETPLRGRRPAFSNAGYYVYDLRRPAAKAVYSPAQAAL